VGGILTNGTERPAGAPGYHGRVTSRFGRLLLVGLAAALLVSGCGGTPRPEVARDAPATAALPVPNTTPEPEETAGLVPGPHDSFTADARAARIPAFRRPGKGTPFEIFENPDQYGARRSFLVKRIQGDWYQVYLPMRPNGVTGWIRARDVKLRLNPYRVEVDLSSNRLRVFEGAKKLMDEAVAAGTGGTPTPKGLFYTTILVKPPDPGGAYGPFAYGLSAYSEVLFSFGGGDGQVAIHGTNDPSSIGNDVSHGCIRMNNEAIRKLATFLPLGTPVEIRP
jgi:lipoprotein-anchoring transpeptidase ErfK/SrfK